MLFYTNNFQERKDKVDQKVLELRGKEDHFIVKSLYNLANFQDKYGEDGERRIASTIFTLQSNKDLMNNFLKDRFKDMDVHTMTHLFQELYNRATVKNGNSPRYVVSVRNIEEGVMGFMEPYSNDLTISKNMIYDFRMFDGYNPRANNATSAGPMFANVLLHETRHTCQMENVMRFATGELTTKEEKATACLTLMKQVVEDIAYFNGDKTLIDYIEKNYWYDFDEHDANMYPLEYVKECYEKGEISDSVFAEVMHSWEEESLGFRVEAKDKTKVRKNCEARVKTMEKITNHFIDIFDKRTRDGEFKKEILDTLKEYMEVDKNGDSPFRNRLRDDFNSCCEVFFAKDKYMKGKNKVKEEENALSI